MHGSNVPNDTCAWLGPCGLSVAGPHGPQVRVGARAHHRCHPIRATWDHVALRLYARGEPFGRTCTKSNPKRPFTHRLPCVTSEPSGERTFTIRLSWTWSERVQPTPQ
jgi:hypothetical protein